MLPLPEKESNVSSTEATFSSGRYVDLCYSNNVALLHQKTSRLFIKLLIVPSPCLNSVLQTFKSIENLTLFYFCEWSVQGCLFYRRTLLASVIHTFATRKGRLNYWSFNSQHSMLCESLSTPSKCKGPSYLKAFISIYVGLDGVNKCNFFSNSSMFVCYC